MSVCIYYTNFIYTYQSFQMTVHVEDVPNLLLDQHVGSSHLGDHQHLHHPEAGFCGSPP